VRDGGNKADRHQTRCQTCTRKGQSDVSSRSSDHDELLESSSAWAAHTHVDSNTDQSTGSLASLAAASRSHIAKQYKQYNKYKSRAHQSSPEDEEWDAVSGASDTAMEAGGENDYHSPEWHQAGRNADATDTAGPGEHGLLECTVTKPQKEGEGTQNAYISYLVTTDVCTKIHQAPAAIKIAR